MRPQTPSLAGSQPAPFGAQSPGLQSPGLQSLSLQSSGGVAGSPPAATAAEQSLLDFARRAARQPPMLALVLHLSSLRPPAPRPHHLRIARAMLHEVVQRYGGEVLGLSCGDMVLLCPQPDSGAGQPVAGAAVDVTSPFELPGFLVRLFRVDAPEPERLVSLWPLPRMAAGLLSYATARSISPMQPRPDAARADAARPEPARIDLAQIGLAQIGVAQIGTAQVGMARTAPGRAGSPRSDQERSALARAGAPASAAETPGMSRSPAGRPAPARPEHGRPEVERRNMEPAAQTATLDALAAAAAAANITEILHRQTAVLLPSSAADRGTLQPLFREISFSITALEARIGVGIAARADPYLFRHLATRLDARMLAMLAATRQVGGALDRADASDADAPPGPPLHLNLSLAAIGSPAFTRFADARRAHTHAHTQTPGNQGGGGIEVSVMEACADPAAFAAARSLVQGAGFAMVLDRVSHLALSLAQLWPLQPDLVKLEWSATMARLEPPDAERLEAALTRIGAGRLLLLRADSEAAVRWGLAHGIRRFQGRHVDAMLAASRLAACAHADGCTLRQCSERAEAAGEAGRRFCRNTRLLDAAVPGLAGPAGRVREVA